MENGDFCSVPRAVLRENRGRRDVWLSYSDLSGIQIDALFRFALEGMRDANSHWHILWDLGLHAGKQFPLVTGMMLGVAREVRAAEPRFHVYGYAEYLAGNVREVRIQGLSNYRSASQGDVSSFARFAEPIDLRDIDEDNGRGLFRYCSLCFGTIVVLVP